MSLLVSQFREERAKDKKNTYEEARTPFAFKTGIDLLDYKNGKYVVPGEGKPYYSLGIDEGTYIMLIGKSGSGKGNLLSANIVTPSGYRKMGDLSVGDEVCTPDGKSAKILNIFPLGKKDVYKVSFTDDTYMLTNDEHLFTVEYLCWDRHKEKTYRKSKTVEVKELMKDYKDAKNKLKYYIPLTKPVNFDPVNLPIDPYLLGALIGDGSLTHKHSLVFSNVESDIIDKINYIINRDYDGCLNPKKNGRDYSIKNCNKVLKNSLEKLGLIGSRAWEKFIPEIYKYASSYERLELLRGLIDTDGCIEKKCCTYYYTTSKQLAFDVKFLVESLGGTAKIKEKETYYNKKGDVTNRKKVKLTYRIFIKMPLGVKAYSSKKHAIQDFYEPKVYKEPYRKIKNIEKMGYKEEMQCIYIDHPDHLYMADDFVVTHNTTIALQIAGNIIRPYDEGAIFIDDIEGATDKTRIKNITGWSSQEVREKVVHRNTGITSESFYKNIDSIYQSKMKLVEEYGTQYTIETDKVDEYGEPIIILPPTVYILDSLALLSPEKISEEEELSGNMSQTSVARVNASVFRRILPKLKKANIILIVINHITQKIEINPMVHTKAQINYLKQDESIPGEIMIAA